MAKRRRTSKRKTFRKKTSAKRVAKRSHRKVYKVKSGWRLGRCA